MDHLLRKKPPKVLAALLSVGALSTVAAYGGAASASVASHRQAKPAAKPFAGQTLTVFDGAPSGASAKEVQAYYNDLSALFHKETGATVNWQYYSTAAQEVTTIETAAVSGNGPDIISYGTSFVGTLQATHEFPLLSQQNWNTLGGQKSIIQADLFDSGVQKGKYIGVPYETNPFVLSYNTADFKKAGITSPPKTWSELVQDAQKIQKAIPGTYGLGMDPSDAFDPWKSVYFIDKQLGGGHWISPNGKKIALDSSTMRKALQSYFSLFYKFHVVPPQAMTWTGADMASAFTQNKVAMEIISSYDPTLAPGTKLQGHLGYALLPTIPYGMTSLPKGALPIETETTGNYWAIPSYARPKRQLALEFEKLSLSPAIQLSQFKLLGWMPVNQAGVRAVEAYSKQAKPFIQAETSAYPTSVAPVWSYVETGMLTAIHNIAAKLATDGGKWNAGYANQQLATAQAAAQAHA